MFKELGYEKAILDGTAIEGNLLKSDPVRPGHHQPIGTKSEMVPYRLNGKQIAICHRYRRPDGTLGASGLPDPKMLEYRGIEYFCHSQPCRTTDCIVCKSPPIDWRDIV
jgi:hypothetical protein